MTKFKLGIIFAVLFSFTLVTNTKVSATGYTDEDYVGMVGAVGDHFIVGAPYRSETHYLTGEAELATLRSMLSGLDSYPYAKAAAENAITALETQQGNYNFEGSDLEDFTSQKESLTFEEFKAITADQEQFDMMSSPTFVWITKDDQRIVELVDVQIKAIEKNQLIQEELANLDTVIERVGTGGGRSQSFYPTGYVDDMTSRIEGKICEDPLYIAADQSAARAAEEYGKIYLPNKYPTAEGEAGKYEELKKDLLREEIAFTIAISNYNIERITENTETTLVRLKDQDERADNETAKLSVNSATIAAISSEIIPLIVNTATSSTLDAASVLRSVLKEDIDPIGEEDDDDDDTQDDDDDDDTQDDDDDDDTQDDDDDDDA